MNVVELLYKLRMLANVEVVVALLPEMVGVSLDAKAEVAAHALKGGLKDSSVRVGREQRTAVITTKSYEVALAGVVITRKPQGMRSA